MLFILTAVLLLQDTKSLDMVDLCQLDVELRISMLMLFKLRI